jgi:N-acyl-D-aspartate/D-glutamate deacylase
MELDAPFELEMTNVKPVQPAQLPEIDPTSPLGIALIILMSKQDNIEDEKVMRALEDEIKRLSKNEIKTIVSHMEGEGRVNMGGPVAIAVIAGLATTLGQPVFGQVLANLAQPMTTGYASRYHSSVHTGATNRKQSNEQELSVYRDAAQSRQQADQTFSQVASSLLQQR